MRRWMLMLSVAAMAATSACASHKKDLRPAAADATPRDWRTVATSADRDRVRNWRTAWTQALTKLTAAADRNAAAAQGVLLQPDAALTGPSPPPGAYRCRVIKLGAKGAGGIDYIAYPAFQCRITREGGSLRLAKLSGSQRPAGLLFPDDEGRMIFLGAMTLGDERHPLTYGRDEERDMAGILERIGPRVWRLVLPYPHWESTLDVMELMPAE